MITITNTLPTQPAVKIVIDGLFILCLDDNAGEATLGVYEHSTDHRFSIRISEKNYGCANASTIGRGGNLIHDLDDQNEIVNGDIFITIPDRVSNIQLYHHSNLVDNDFYSDPTDLASKISTNQDEYEPDFRWVMDLEGPRFYDRKLQIVPGVINRVIRVNQGIFYTERFIGRTIRQAYPEAGIRLGSSFPNRSYYVATQLAIAIEVLLAGEFLDISYTDPSGPRTISLPPPAANSFYEIYASNNCSLSEESRRMIEGDVKPRHSDFQYYYNVINLPVVDRMDLEIFLPGAGSSNFPCDFTFLGLTTGVQ
jgi:hypothetical protein